MCTHECECINCISGKCALLYCISFAISFQSIVAKGVFKLKRKFMVRDTVCLLTCACFMKRESTQDFNKQYNSNCFSTYGSATVILLWVVFMLL